MNRYGCEWIYLDEWMPFIQMIASERQRYRSDDSNKTTETFGKKTGLSHIIGCSGEVTWCLFRGYDPAKLVTSNRNKNDLSKHDFIEGVSCRIEIKTNTYLDGTAYFRMRTFDTFTWDCGVLVIVDIENKRAKVRGWVTPQLFEKHKEILPTGSPAIWEGYMNQDWTWLP